MIVLWISCVNLKSQACLNLLGGDDYNTILWAGLKWRHIHKLCTCQCHYILQIYSGMKLIYFTPFIPLHIKSTSTEIWRRKLASSCNPQTKLLTKGSDELCCSENVRPISVAGELMGDKAGCALQVNMENYTWSQQKPDSYICALQSYFFFCQFHRYVSVEPF